MDPTYGLQLLGFIVIVALLFAAALMALFNHTIPYLCKKVIDHRDMLPADHPASPKNDKRSPRKRLSKGQVESQPKTLSDVH